MSVTAPSMSLRKRPRSANSTSRRLESRWLILPIVLFICQPDQVTAFAPHPSKHQTWRGYHRLPFQRHEALFSTPDVPLLGVDNDTRYAASDWLHNMRSIRRSTILRETKGPVLAVMGWSIFLSLVHQGLIWGGLIQWAQRMCVSSKPHSLLVSALGLLLVFRTNSAYQRFAEGRVIWERIHSLSRNTSRMALLYKKEFGEQRLQRFFRLLAAFPYLLHQHIHPATSTNSSLSPQKNGLYSDVHSHSLEQDAVPSKKFPSSDDKSKIYAVDRRNLPWSLFPTPALQQHCMQASNRPLWICDRLAEVVNDIDYTDNFTSRERLTFLSHTGKLSKCVGECERIHQTAVPLNYARHSLRSLTLWLFTLPFALLEDFGLITGPVMGLAAWMFYGIYQIGFTIEDPFQGSLRLSALCDAIFRDIMDVSSAMRMTAFSATSDEGVAPEQELSKEPTLSPTGTLQKP